MQMILFPYLYVMHSIELLQPHHPNWVFALSMFWSLAMAWAYLLVGLMIVGQAKALWTSTYHKKTLKYQLQDFWGFYGPLIAGSMLLLCLLVPLTLMAR